MSGAALVHKVAPEHRLKKEAATPDWEAAGLISKRMNL